MSNYYAIERSPDYLEHYGILGMKWGIRRFQNPDGSLTEEGRKRYGDILTKDQMNNMIKGYNLRTGSNKKLTKNTIFKTDHGTYDSKGKRIDTDTEVKDPGNEKSKKTKSSVKEKKLSELSDKELKEINERMQDEINYLNRYAQLHPKNQTAIQKMADNFKNALIKDLPEGVSAGIKQYIAESIKSAANQSKPNNQSKPEPPKPPKPEAPKTPKPEAPKPEASAAKETVKEPVKEAPRYDSRNSNAMDFFGTRFSDLGSSESTKESVTRNLPAVVGDTRIQTLDQASLYGDLWDDIKKFKGGK
jgi:hypothetical protein